MRDASIYDIAAQAQAGPKRPLFTEVLAADPHFRRGVDAVVRETCDRIASRCNGSDQSWYIEMTNDVCRELVGEGHQR